MSHIKLYSDPSNFWDEISPYLRAEEAKNSLMLGLAYLFRIDPKNCKFQGALIESGKLAGAVLCSQYVSQNNLIVSAADPKSARAIFDSIRKSKISLKGIIGDPATVEIYRSLFAKMGEKSKLNMKQGIYKCRKVVPPETDKSLKFRVANLGDLPTLGQWIEAFHKEAVPHDPPVKGGEIARAKIEKKMIFVLEKDGKLVSMAGWGRDIETSCSINLVFTPKSFRKKGFASQITAQLTQFHLSQGKFETNLYTDMSNPTSNKIYQDIGYEFVCDSVHFGFL